MLELHLVVASPCTFLIHFWLLWNLWFDDGSLKLKKTKFVKSNSPIYLQFFLELSRFLSYLTFHQACWTKDFDCTYLADTIRSQTCFVQNIL